ncbi:tannase/feruloyl esterase family alpha/beta hydrolase [Uliginosibacterium sp. 31-12]|uniref:tannase/feruloyl esterase family alpha/beta hydrolase n=1 Tax=Uliginosibacterium sp. 31-12 TaxID=3062781 RepID=UPI0026E24FA3|nr:tannase/feruloyl esterase family alpha/beta hydrolase [Uliginosibacterium sp. 31-12]MDO6387852.1 tannase/feruloyl esterase family alpha/beta hydrolase [Uliginosibacterium sp. 31-12]
MRKRDALRVLLALAASLLLCPGVQAATPEVVKPVQSCSGLLATALSDIGGEGSQVLSARESVKEGVAMCVLEGRLAPAIGFRVSLPVEGWTQRYLQIGCGGLCGRIPEEVGAAEGCVPLKAGGFVIASTDMGHQGMGGEFGRDEALRIDFAHRAVHLTAVAAKKLIRAYYGRAEAFAYFTGCSDGGREALMEAQRYPEDFDGIIAGAAAMNFQVQNGLYHAWQARANTGADGQAILQAARLPLLHQAVLAQCDGLDGLQDGLLSDPRLCHFDPASLQCPVGAASPRNDCLSAAEVDAVRKLYAGPRDPRSGERLIIGGPQYGSELAWVGVFVPRAAGQPIFSGQIALDALRNLSFERNPPESFSLADIHFDQAMLEQLKPLHPLYDATNPDLRAFAAAGGKLILWHGWADPHISPLNTLAYHEALEQFMGKQEAAAFERLYLLPGVYHCADGEGPSLVDFLTPMQAWVEQGQVPQAVLAKQAASRPRSSFGQPGALSPAVEASPAPAKTRARPLYPYPALAALKPGADPDQAASYAAAPARFTASTPAWSGSSLFTPYRAR